MRLAPGDPRRRARIRSTALTTALGRHKLSICMVLVASRRPRLDQEVGRACRSSQMTPRVCQRSCCRPRRTCGEGRHERAPAALSGRSFESEPPTARKRSEKWMLDCRSTAAAAARADAAVADDAPAAPRPLRHPSRAPARRVFKPPRTGCDLDLRETTMVARRSRSDRRRRRATIARSLRTRERHWRVPSCHHHEHHHHRPRRGG